jgi:predicted MPP superfamily phosphohydrolase
MTNIIPEHANMAAVASIRRWAGALTIGAAVGLTYSLWEAQDYRIRHLTVPNLPAGAEPLRVLHISDLHLTPHNRKLAGWLGSLIDLEPHLVVGTGDFIAHPDSVALLTDSLGPLLDVPGAFVLGSNDYYAPQLRNPARYLRSDDGRRFHGPELPWAQLRQDLARRGWADLTNARTRLSIGGLDVELRGVDDPHINRDNYNSVAGSAAGDLAIGVAHAPYRRILTAMAVDQVDLLLAGHTHGGQLCLPVTGALVTNCDLERGRASGLSRQVVPGATGGNAPFGGRDGQGMFVHVSAGLGTSPYTPVRFCCPPTATLLTLI